MFDGRTNLSSDVVVEVRNYFSDQVFETVIPRNIRLAEAPSYGMPISAYAPNSPGALAHKSLALEIMEEDGYPAPDVGIKNPPDPEEEPSEE
jgi:chromosome partitioning protein